MDGPEALRRTWVVAQREFRERARSRAFQLSTLLAVLVMAAIVVLPALVSGGTKTYRVGLAGAVPGGVAGALAAQADAAHLRLQARSYDSVALGEQAVRDKKIDVLLVDGSALEWRQQSDAQLAALVGNAVQSVRIQERASRLGMSAEELGALLTPVTLSSRRLGTAVGVDDSARAVAVYEIILLFAAVSMYGNLVLTGVVQEKQSRVAEVLLARMRPRELLAGKVIGIGALGLTQFGLILATAAVCLASVRNADAPHVAASLWVWLVIWFVSGYALFSVVYAALGALASRVEDASTAAAPVGVVIFACYIAAMAAIESPESSLAVVLSFVPATAPMVMPIRLTLTDVPLWQAVGSALLTGATIWVLVRLAGRVYSGAVLRTGTRIPLRAAWRSGASQP